jgi:hypothetical protein
MRRAIVQRRPIGIESGQLPENKSFMAMSKAVLESPKNLHAGIRFFLKTRPHQLESDYAQPISGTET